MDEGTGEGTEEGGGKVGQEGEEGGECGDVDGELDESERVGVDGWSGGRRRRDVAYYEQARESTRSLDDDDDGDGGGGNDDKVIQSLRMHHAPHLLALSFVVGTGTASSRTLHYSERNRQEDESETTLSSLLLAGFSVRERLNSQFEFDNLRVLLNGITTSMDRGRPED